MDQKIKGVRVYTGSGYEDFIIGRPVTSQHILWGGDERIKKVVYIYINPVIQILLDSGEKLEFSPNVSSRIIYE